MRRWKKIVLGVLLVLVVAVGGLGIWQRENIAALYTWLTNDSESISEDLHNKQQHKQEMLEQDYHITVTPPSIDISNDLLDGKVSAEDVKESLGINDATKDELPQTGQSVPSLPDGAQSAGTGQQTEEQPQTPAEPELTEEERVARMEDLVNRCVAELYACEVDLMAQLGEMKQAAVDEWKALRPNERTKAKKQEIGFAGLEACYELEVLVDADVNAILDKYRDPIRELGGDTAVLDELWIYYCDKKATQKAYYLDKYLD